MSIEHMVNGHGAALCVVLLLVARGEVRRATRRCLRGLHHCRARLQHRGAAQRCTRARQWLRSVHELSRMAALCSCAN